MPDLLEDFFDVRADASEPVRLTLQLLSDTAPATDRINGLRTLGLTVSQIAVACDVSPESIRLWGGKRTPRPHHERLLDTTRFVAMTLLRRTASRSETRQWLLSTQAELGGTSPIEAMPTDTRAVTQLAMTTARSLYERRAEALAAAAQPTQPPPSPRQPSSRPPGPVKRTPGKRKASAKARGSRTAARARHEAPQLTPREQQIATLVRQRKSTKAIAQTLELPPSVLEEILAVLMQKFGQTSKRGLRDVLALRRRHRQSVVSDDVTAG